MGECLARKHKQSGTFYYYFRLILIYFKSDGDETWQEYAMGRNLLKFENIFDIIAHAR